MTLNVITTLPNIWQCRFFFVFLHIDKEIHF